MHLTFLGAVETVTGSKYLIEDDNKKILIDCGLFQGEKDIRIRNWQKLPFEPKDLDAIILTHAHIDHSGYLPVLVKNGFTGKIYCSHGTKDLCSILLPDSGFLQEEEANNANLHQDYHHSPTLPLYTQEDSDRTLELFETVNFGVQINISDQLSFMLFHAGHIIGASLVQLTFGQSKILFSGDLGRLNDPLMRPPATIQDTDYLVLESTYGNQLHDKTDPFTQIAEIINKTIKRGGSIVMPAFAVGRTQCLLYILYKLNQNNKIPDVPIFLDSPMAINATQLLCKYSNEHKLSNQVCEEVCAIATYINTREESKEIDHYDEPIIILSASGMAEGGRVLYHLKTYLPDPRNTILFTGYQANGTRGAELTTGKSAITIQGEEIPANAEIINLKNLSAHADCEEILSWLSHFRRPPIKTFITHGEQIAATTLQENIQSKLNWQCIVPKYMQREEL